MLWAFAFINSSVEILCFPDMYEKETLQMSIHFFITLTVLINLHIFGMSFTEYIYTDKT